MRKINAGTVIINSEERCLSRCTFCPGVLVDNLSSSEKLEKFKKDSQHFISQGVQEIEISGVDPIQYSRIVEAVKYLKDNGVSKVVLSTHGRNLKDKTLAQELASAGLDYCRIPLYGSTAELHNKVMHYVAPHDPGSMSVGNSFEDMTEAIHNCSDVNIYIKGHIVPNQYNQHDISNIIDLYLDLTQGKMVNLVVASACIADKSEEYTSDWYLPIKDSKEVLNSIVDHSIVSRYPRISYLVMDYPYCVLGKMHPNIKNLNLVPNMGTYRIAEDVRSEVSDHIPSYRIKTFFNDCDTCVAKGLCAGIYKNDLEMFGSEGLSPLTPERFF